MFAVATSITNKITPLLQSITFKFMSITWYFQMVRQIRLLKDEIAVVGHMMIDYIPPAAAAALVISSGLTVWLTLVINGSLKKFLLKISPGVFFPLFLSGNGNGVATEREGGKRPSHFQLINASFHFQKRSPLPISVPLRHLVLKKSAAFRVFMVTNAASFIPLAAPFCLCWHLWL